MRFVKARRARARVSHHARRRRSTTVASAHPGRRASASAGNAYVRVSRNSRSGAALTGVIAHELGHVLGLGHEDGTCATMNSVPWSLCGRQKPCSILQDDDVRGAIHRYGGRLRKQAGVLCPPAPAAPTIDLIPGSYRAQARFTDAQRAQRRRLRGGRRRRVVPGHDSPTSAPSWTARGGQDVTFDITPFQDPHAAAGKELCAKIWTLGEARTRQRPAGGRAEGLLDRADPAPVRPDARGACRTASSRPGRRRRTSRSARTTSRGTAASRARRPPTTSR